MCHPSWDPDTGFTHSPKVGQVLRGTWGPIPNSQGGSEGGKGIGTLTKGHSNSRTKHRLFPLGSMWAWPRDRPGGTGSLLHSTLVTGVVQVGLGPGSPNKLCSAAHPNKQVYKPVLMKSRKRGLFSAATLERGTRSPVTAQKSTTGVLT